MTWRRPGPTLIAAAVLGLALAVLVVFGLGLPWWTILITGLAVGVVLTFNV